MLKNTIVYKISFSRITSLGPVMNIWYFTFIICSRLQDESILRRRVWCWCWQKRRRNNRHAYWWIIYNFTSKNDHLFVFISKQLSGGYLLFYKHKLQFLNGYFVYLFIFTCIFVVNVFHCLTFSMKTSFLRISRNCIWKTFLYILYLFVQPRIIINNLYYCLTILWLCYVCYENHSASFFFKYMCKLYICIYI